MSQTTVYAGVDVHRARRSAGGHGAQRRNHVHEHGHARVHVHAYEPEPIHEHDHDYERVYENGNLAWRTSFIIKLFPCIQIVSFFLEVWNCFSLGLYSNSLDKTTVS